MPSFLNRLSLQRKNRNRPKKAGVFGYYPYFFDKKFITDSFSCRLEKGTHRAINRFKAFAYKASRNHTRTAWVLKCDIKKFFASIDQTVLMSIIDRRTRDKKVVALIAKIVGSFSSTDKGVGLPLGNLTSQLLVNIYMNEFDQFAKHRLKAKYYIRYADDFVIMSRDREWLIGFIPRISDFLRDRLNLILHPNKISVGTVASGTDYLGWINFSNHRIVRHSTKKRMFRRILEMRGKIETVQSYLGLIGRGNNRKLEAKINVAIENISKT